MQRVPPSTKTRQAIRELLESGVADEQDPRSTLMRLAMRFVAEEALEAKVRDLLSSDSQIYALTRHLPLRTG